MASSQDPGLAADSCDRAIFLGENILLQQPLSQTSGASAGIVIFLPSTDRIGLDSTSTTPYDPDPVTRWAQEGFSVVSITNYDGLLVTQALKVGLDALQNQEKVTVKDKFAIIVYDPHLINSVSAAAANEGSRVACFIGHGSFASPSLSIPIVLHLTANAPRPAQSPSDATTIYTYPITSSFFALPRSSRYDAISATQANDRTLRFIRHWLLSLTQ